MRLTSEQKNVLITSAAQLKRRLEDNKARQAVLTEVTKFISHVKELYSKGVDFPLEEVKEYYNHCTKLINDLGEQYTSAKLPPFSKIEKFLKEKNGGNL